MASLRRGEPLLHVSFDCRGPLQRIDPHLHRVGTERRGELLHGQPAGRVEQRPGCRDAQRRRRERGAGVHLPRGSDFVHRSGGHETESMLPDLPDRQGVRKQLHLEHQDLPGWSRLCLQWLTLTPKTCLTEQLPFLPLRQQARPELKLPHRRVKEQP